MTSDFFFYNFDLADPVGAAADVIFAETECFVFGIKAHDGKAAHIRKAQIAQFYIAFLDRPYDAEFLVRIDGGFDGGAFIRCKPSPSKAQAVFALKLDIDADGGIGYGTHDLFTAVRKREMHVGTGEKRLAVCRYGAIAASEDILHQKRRSETQAAGCFVRYPERLFAPLRRNRCKSPFHVESSGVGNEYPYHARIASSVF